MKAGDKKFYLDSKQRPCGLVKLIDRGNYLWVVEAYSDIYNWDDLENPVLRSEDSQWTCSEDELSPKDPPFRLYAIGGAHADGYIVTDENNVYLGKVYDNNLSPVAHWGAYARDTGWMGQAYATKEQAAEALRE